MYTLAVDSADCVESERSMIVVCSHVLRGVIIYGVTSDCGGHYRLCFTTDISGCLVEVCFSEKIADLAFFLYWGFDSSRFNDPAGVDVETDGCMHDLLFDLGI